MTREELEELCGMLVKQLIDAAALNHYYALLVREPKRPRLTWGELTQFERDAYASAALTQIQTVFKKLGWGMEIHDLKAMAGGTV